MTDYDSDDVDTLKEALITMIKSDKLNGQVGDAIIAACMLSEGMDMTFELFEDKWHAIEAILTALTKVGKQHGVKFESAVSSVPLH